MSKKSRKLLSNVVMFFMAFVLTFNNIGLAFAADDNMVQTPELEDYDLSSIKYTIFDGENYYDYSEEGVPYSRNYYRIVLKELPTGLHHKCVGDLQKDSGEYKVIIKFYGDNKHNPVPDKEILLKINKADRNMSNVDYYDSNVAYDGQDHKLEDPTNLPFGVEVDRYEGVELAKEPGSYAKTVYFKNSGEDASNYNDIPPMTAVLTIVGEKDPNKLDYDETSISFSDETFVYDGKIHSISVKGVPEGVVVYYTNNRNSKKGTHDVIAHFKGDDNHNPILDRKATVTIIEDESEEDSDNSGGPGVANKPEKPSEPDDSNKPDDTEKPTEPDDSNKPDDTEKPTEPDDSNKPDQPDEPTKPEEQHIWGPWTYKNESEDERECSHCGIKQTEEHKYVAGETQFEDNQDGTHIVKTTYSCTNCANTYVDSVQEDCEYGDWQYVGNSIEVVYCNSCNHQETRAHQHEEAPEDLQYNCKSSNGDDTHELEATYTCSVCNETITLNKVEDCDYEVSYTKTGVNDIHMKVEDCTVCGYHKEAEDACVPTGDMQCIGEGPYIYDYYDCGLCGDRCKRKFHTEHRFQPWEYRDADTHIRYCVCSSEDLGGREIEEHNYQYDKDNYTGELLCDKCGSTKPVPEHDHGFDTHDEMGILEVYSSPSYGELVDKGQIVNPNPSPDSWCSRYEYKCKTCGIKYYVKYAHRFVDGKCTRNYCGNIAQNPTNIIALDVMKKVANLNAYVEVPKVENNKPVEETKVEVETSTEETKVEEETSVEETTTEETEVEGEVSTEETEVEGEVSTEETEAEGEVSTEETEAEGEVSTEETEAEGEVSTEETEAEGEVSTEETEAEGEVSTEETEAEGEVSTEETEVEDEVSTEETEVESEVSTEETEVEGEVSTEETEAEGEVSTEETETKNMKLVVNVEAIIEKSQNEEKLKDEEVEEAAQKDGANKEAMQESKTSSMV